MHGSVGHISRKNPETLENIIQYDQKRLNLNSNWSLNKSKHRKRTKQISTLSVVEIGRVFETTALN